MTSVVAAREPQRILVAGDIHGDEGWFRELVARARAADCQAIVQLGDLGYWPRIKHYSDFLDALPHALVEAEIDLFFIEGNHDDVDVLLDDDLTEAGVFRRVAERVFYIPRGTRWGWGGVRFLGVGGGYSLDRDLRRAGFDWFERETLSEAELAAILEPGGEVDILVSHDCPAAIARRLGFELTSAPLAHQCALDTIVDRLVIPLVLHGHLHQSHVTFERSGEGDGHFYLAVGFAAEIAPVGNFLIFDLASLGQLLARVRAKAIC